MGSYFEEVGKRIRLARENKELTQSQLGNKLTKPLTATALSLYESGDREVSVSVLVEIAEILDVKLEYLIKGSGEGDDNAESIQLALRSDKDLWNNKKARDQVIDFIDFVKGQSKKEN